jgi:hypothetical protein
MFKGTEGETPSAVLKPERYELRDLVTRESKCPSLLKGKRSTREI